MTALDRGALVDELLARIDRHRDDDVAVARALVDDWAAEADPMPDPAAVLRFLREDLETAIAHCGGDVAAGARLVLLQRRVNRVSAATLAAARARRDGAGAGDARALLARVEVLAASVAELPASAARPAASLRQALGDAMLDARFAAEGDGPTSLRLAHDAPPTSSAPGGSPPPPPPDVRPA